jgi:hypothetical protein
MERKRWTPDDIAKLQSMAGKYPDAQIAAGLGRSLGATRHKGTSCAYPYEERPSDEVNATRVRLASTLRAIRKEGGGVIQTLLAGWVLHLNEQSVSTGAMAVLVNPACVHPTSVSGCTSLLRLRMLLGTHRYRLNCRLESSSLTARII